MSTPQAPGPRRFSPLGSLPEFNRDALALFARAQGEYGDIVRLRLAHRAAHVLSHPEMAEQALITDTASIVKYTQVKAQLGLSLILGKGLLSSYGELWRRQRDFMNPMFRPRSIEALADAMKLSALRMVARLDAHAASATPADIWRESTRAALETVIAALFGAEDVRNSDEMSEAMTVLLRHAFSSIRNPLTPPLSWPTRRNRQFREALRTVDDCVGRLIQDRLSAGERRPDFLDLLLFEPYKDTGQRMPPQLVRDEAVTMLGAGHETTAAALTWALVQIARQPRIAQKLRQELRQVAGEEPLQVSHLVKMRYLQAVVQETLRLYGPVASITRAVIRDTTIAGYPIPARSMLFVCVHNIHRHADYWRQPHDFMPERFLAAEETERKHRCAYIPFGAGERFCIGRNFASLELQLFLAQIIGGFDLQMMKSDIESEFAITLRPAEPVYMRATRLGRERTPAAA